MADAKRLAHWVLSHSDGRPVSHLKLQKLLFYCFGAASAYDLETELGEVQFEAWEHGPVNRPVYDEYRSCGSAAIQPPATRIEYASEVTGPLTDALIVYGQLDAWSLRQQSHLEAPWIQARKNGAGDIDPISIKAHFRSKFCGRHVDYPEYLADTGSFRLDRIPVQGFGNLHELARAVLRNAHP